MTMAEYFKEFPELCGHKVQTGEANGHKKFVLGPFSFYEVKCGCCWALTGPEGKGLDRIVPLRESKDLSELLCYGIGIFAAWLTDRNLKTLQQLQDTGTKVPLHPFHIQSGRN